MPQSAWAATWKDVYEYALTQHRAVEAGEGVWIESCPPNDGSCYRVWKRPVNTTVHRTHMEGDFTVSWYAVMGPSGTTPQTLTWYKGNGTLETETAAYSGPAWGGIYQGCTTGICSSENNYFQINNPSLAGDINTVTHSYSCSFAWSAPSSGTLSGGSVAGSARAPTLLLGKGYAPGRSAGQCRTGDVLLQEFTGVVPGSCVADLGVTYDKTWFTSDCTCVPDGWVPGGKVTTPFGEKCSITPGIGDHADVDGLSAPGSSSSPPAEDLPGTSAPSSWPDAPSSGGASTPNPVGGIGSIPSSWTTGGGGTEPPAPIQYGSSTGAGTNITGITSAITGAIGDAVKTGVGDALDRTPKDPETGEDVPLPDGTEPNPNVQPSELPEDRPWWNLVSAFRASSPWTSWLTGHTVTLTGAACSVAPIEFPLFGSSVAIPLDACPFESVLETIGVALLAITAFTAALVIFGGYKLGGGD